MKAIGKFFETKVNRLEMNFYGFPGEHEWEATEFFQENYPEVIMELSWDENSWSDIMVDECGKTYAVIAEDSLSAGNAKAVLVEIEM